jgi:dipeptide transport system substrate-binding protein
MFGLRALMPLLALTLCAAPAGAQTLVFCSEGSPEALNPQMVTTTTGMNAARPLFNNLVEFKPGTTQIVPALAESWTVSNDGKVYTFRLREDVKFHSNRLFKPTRMVNADDVVFSIMRQWKEDHPYHRIAGSGFDYFKDTGMHTLLESVEKVDDRTVRIALKRPDATFLSILAMVFNGILSAEYADHLSRAGTPELIDRHPIGTGPFMFVSYQKDTTVRYRVFPDHWAGRQPIENLVFSITPNPIVRLTKLKAGECQVMALPNPGDAQEIAASPSLKLLQQEGFNIGYLAMNVNRPPFTDVKVRRAVNMAINKALIVEAVYQGAGKVAKNPIPPTLWSYNDAIEDYPYDPEQAQKMLRDAGYPQGFETDLWYMPVSRPYNPNAKRVAEMIQADLSKIGVRLNLKTDDWANYRAKLHAGEHSMALFGWTGDNGDPDNFLHVLLGCTAARSGGNNVAKWCEPEYDELVTRAKRSGERTERDGLYRKAQEIFKREAPWVPLAHSVVFMATRKEVQGFVIDPLGRHPFEGVSLNQ